MQNDKGKLIKSSVARLKPYQTRGLVSTTLIEGPSLDDSDASSQSEPPMAARKSGVLSDEKDLENQNRAKKRTTRVQRRNCAQNSGKLPVVYEPFFGHQPLGVRRSDRLKNKKS